MQILILKLEKPLCRPVISDALPFPTCFNYASHLCEHGYDTYFDHVLYLQILDLFFSISLSLPRSVNAIFGLDIEKCYGALSALEDVIAILRSVSQITTLFFGTLS